jgi:predicted nucleotidyltransferase
MKVAVKDLKEIAYLAECIKGRTDSEFISEFAYEIEEDAKSILAIVEQYTLED